MHNTRPKLGVTHIENGRVKSLNYEAVKNAVRRISYKLQIPCLGTGHCDRSSETTYERKGAGDHNPSCRPRGLLSWSEISFTANLHRRTTHKMRITKNFISAVGGRIALILPCCLGFIAIDGHATPVIVKHPESRVAQEGASLSLYVTTTEQFNRNQYQWQFNKKDIKNETYSYITLRAVKPSDEGLYRVIVSSNDGSRVLSTEARVSIVPPNNQWNYKKLHQFGGTSGAPSGPRGQIAQSSDGYYYGTTIAGGTGELGSIFRFLANGEVEIMYSFTGGGDGGFPLGGLAVDREGWLYGTTSAFGSGGNGTVFRFRPENGLEVIYSFTGGADGGKRPTNPI